MRFDDIHGTDRVYTIINKNGKVISKTFAIKGYGKLDTKKEARFRHLIDVFKIKYVYKDIRF